MAMKAMKRKAMKGMKQKAMKAMEAKANAKTQKQRQHDRQRRQGQKTADAIDRSLKQMKSGMKQRLANGAHDVRDWWICRENGSVKRIKGSVIMVYPAL